MNQVAVGTDPLPEVRSRIAPERFARGVMTCPSCEAQFSQPVEVCPQCGFSGHEVVQKFPYDPPPLSRVLDPENRMTPEERALVHEEMKRWRRRLPQVHFFSCLISLDAAVNLQEFAFWLFNAANVEEGERAKHFGVLLVIDAQTKRITTTVGYGIEPLLSDEDWRNVVLDCRDKFTRERFGEGVCQFISLAGSRLMARGFEIERELKR